MSIRDADDLDWRADGLCAQVDPELMYPGKGESTAPAKRVCQACPITVKCLTFALDNQERFGVWGGLSERQRRRLRKDAA